MTTSVLSQPTLFAETELPSLMSSAAASHARTSRPLLLVEALASKVSDLVSGRSMHGSLARYDPDTSLWRTSQCCLDGGLAEFSETWPRSGMMRSGTAYRLPPSAPLTDGTECGSLPTPTAKANMMAPSMQKWAAHRNLWPTPTAHLGHRRSCPSPEHAARRWAQGRRNLDDAVPLSEAIGGSLNPTWVEWLQGFPLEWTVCAAWETLSSRRSRRSSAKRS